MLCGERCRSLYIEGAVVSHAGRIRSQNEDNYSLFGSYRQDILENEKQDFQTALPQHAAVAVFDGIGGEEAGETAALIAAKMFMPCAIEGLKEEAERRILHINEAICEERTKRGGVRIGTTMAALYLDHNTAMACNVGDSRCYFLRDGTLYQISLDHSESRRMVELGILTEEEASRSKSRHVLTQHLGIFADEFIIEPYFSQMIALRTGDIFLLCSDGLTDMVKDDELGDILKMQLHVKKKAEILIQTALEHGGRDNVTALVLQVKEAANSSARKGLFKKKR